MKKLDLSNWGHVSTEALLASEFEVKTIRLAVFIFDEFLSSQDSYFTIHHLEVEFCVSFEAEP